MKKKAISTVFTHFFTPKLVRMLKLTCIVLLLGCLQVSARGYSQKITMKLQGAEMKKALQEVERKSGYNFLYKQEILEQAPKVTINVTDAEITRVLDILFMDTPISYKITNTNLVVLKSDRPGAAGFPDLVVTGRVTNATGEPLSSVSVTLKGGNIGTRTDENGHYSISVPNGNAVLIFSSVGFATQEVPVNNRTTIDVSMSTTATELNTIVVVGYGTQRRVDVTGAVSQVRGEEITKQPVVNPISGLQGKVAGVQITNSGAPGASPEIRIRGLGTVYGSATPLYVVDGVWYNDISFLNPADIENISILKDASSESIYGIRAANGVVLVTTKKGRSGEPRVSYTGFAGWQTVTNEVKMANGTQYAQLVNELTVINGNPAPLNVSAFPAGTDWYHQILRSGAITNHQVSVSGGGNNSNYTFSLGYLYQQGIVEKNDYTRYTARLQNDIQVSSPIKVGYSVTSAFNNSNDINGGIFHELYSAAPIVPVHYADGTYGDPSDFNLGGAVGFNPQVTLDFFNQKSKNYRLNGNAFVDLKFLRNFTFKTSLGGEFGQGEVRNYLPVYTATITQRSANSMLSLSRAETRNWIFENTLTYDNRFSSGHNLQLLAGHSAQRYKFYRISSSVPDVPNNSEADYYLKLGTAANIKTTDAGDLSTIESYFGRVNYSFRNRYMVNASLRADGSSKFSGDNRWGYFPSVGVGWVISEEPFMADQKTFDVLKLRGSWGKIGNASVPSNLSVLTVTQTPQFIAFYGQPQEPATGASIDKVVPPTTFWEKSEGIDVGLEATMANRKLYLEADYYTRKTLDAIFDIPILGSVGTSGSSIIGNQATIQNQGWEFTARWNDAVNKNLTYSIAGNIGMNTNKVLEVTTGGNAIYSGGQGITGGALSTRSVVGEPIGQFYGLQVGGIFQSQAEVTGSAQPNAKAGDFRYVDQNGDKIIDAKDRIPLGDPNAKYTYGINTNWSYNNIDLTLDFQGVAGVNVYNANMGYRFGNENFTEDFYLNRWHGAGTSNLYPSANIGGGQNYLPNSFFVEKGDYFRIRNIQLGYTFPGRLVERLRASSLRVYANAQNAFNFFSYRGFSPEISGGSPTGRGIDINVYPLSATYNFGINLNF